MVVRWNRWEVKVRRGGVSPEGRGGDRVVNGGKGRGGGVGLTG